MAPILFSFDELSNYKQVRTPHEVIDEVPVFVHSNAVRSEFTCIICLEILKKTMTAQHCLHRFCYDCISTSLRLGNKECPTCRAKLASKRDLRADPVIDYLIASLFPQEDQQSSESAIILVPELKEHKIQKNDSVLKKNKFNSKEGRNKNDCTSAKHTTKDQAIKKQKETKENKTLEQSKVKTKANIEVSRNKYENLRQAEDNTRVCTRRSLRVEAVHEKTNNNKEEKGTTEKNYIKNVKAENKSINCQNSKAVISAQKKEDIRIEIDQVTNKKIILPQSKKSIKLFQEKEEEMIKSMSKVDKKVDKIQIKSRKSNRNKNNRH